MAKLLSFCILFFIGLNSCYAQQQTKTDKAKAKAYIIAPQHGEVVPPTFTVKFGLRGMGVAPAAVDMENTGHHHLLVDVAELPDLTTALPATDQIIHYGGGQTEASLTLTPGEHTLQLILGDFAHQPHDPPVYSEKIKIYVRE